MNTILNKKWMAWLVLILLLLNISALGTILFFTYGRHHRPVPSEMNDQKMRPGREMIKEIGLNSSQAEVFCNIRQEFFVEIKPILDKLHENRKLIIQEINKDNPDTVYLKNMADTIGKIQADLKKETLSHYLRIRKICNKEQREKLAGFYSAMFMMDEPGKGPGPGMGMRYRRGQQNQEQGMNCPNNEGRGWRKNRDTTGN